MRLYDNQCSGNCYKVRLLLAHLGRDYERVEMDTDRGATRTPEYLEKNPNGRVPMVELDDGRRLAESNAIIYYLAQGSDYWPQDRFSGAQALQWMFFEQYSHEPYIAVSRYIMTHLPDDHPRRAELPGLKPRGEHALAVMDRHLATRAYFAGERFCIADIALYAYTHVAAEGGFELAPFGSVTAWLVRCEAQPRYIPITQ